MPRIVLVSGSPFPSSRTRRLTEWVGRRLAARGFLILTIDVRELPADALLHARAAAAPIREALDAIEGAAGLVVATPVHHTACSGVLKAFLDLLPQTALTGKIALPLAVGGSTAHVLAIDYSLRPILTALGALHVTGGHFLLCGEMERGLDGEPRLEPRAEARLDTVVDAFAASVILHAGASDSAEAGQRRFAAEPRGVIRRTLVP